MELLPSIARVLAACLSSPHFQVAERTLYLWHNEHIGPLLLANRTALFPYLYPALFEGANGHWNPTVAKLTETVLQMFEHDADLTVRSLCFFRSLSLSLSVCLCLSLCVSMGTGTQQWPS